MICNLGVWDDTVPGIVFDDNGISNYARIQNKLMNEFPRGEVGKRKWELMVDDAKMAGKNRSI
jgi:hypothetical protein